jgi:hypothetical protein
MQTEIRKEGIFLTLWPLTCRRILHNISDININKYTDILKTVSIYRKQIILLW